MKLYPDEQRRLYSIVTEMIKVHCEKYNIPAKLIRSRRKTTDIAGIRRIICKTLRENYVERGGFVARKVDRPGWEPLSFPNIGRTLNITHSSVIQLLNKENGNGEKDLSM